MAAHAPVYARAGVDFDLDQYRLWAQSTINSLPPLIEAIDPELARRVLSIDQRLDSYDAITATAMNVAMTIGQWLERPEFFIYPDAQT